MASVDLKEMAREREKRGKCLKCLTVSLSHKMNNKCTKKDNILIYNDLYKNTISHWEDGKMGKWEKCYKDFSNGHTFSDKQTTANFTPLFLKILQIQQHEAWQT